MSEQSIRRLKKQFILVSMISLSITMLAIAGLLYAGNMLLNRQVIRSTLEYIVENDGILTTWEEDGEDGDGEEDSPYSQFLDYFFSTSRNYQSPEFQFSTRYFVIYFDQDQNLTDVRTNHIRAVSEEAAEEYGARALAGRTSFGRFDDYYYKIKRNEDGSGLIVYLDSADVLQSNDRLLYLALMLIGFGMVLAFFIVRKVSESAIHTEVRNAEIQKRFITDASHELKTPLAVIRANTEMQEILNGENEWSTSTLRQVDRMNGLIKNLVMISRADENASQEEAENVDVTKAVAETVENFKVVAESGGKILESSLDENVRMKAENAKIRQLSSLLVDNAIKYCDDGGKIDVILKQKGRGILLTVSNTYANGETVDYSRFFERFYREDESHNIDKGGYGIGLSIAESLVKQYHGTINASWKHGIISFVCVLKYL